MKPHQYIPLSCFWKASLNTCLFTSPFYHFLHKYCTRNMQILTKKQTKWHSHLNSVLNSTYTFQRPKFCIFHGELILLIPGQRSHSDLRNSYSKNIARTSWKIVIGIWWSHLVSNTQKNLSYLSCLYTSSEVVKIRYHYIHSFVKLPCSSHDVVLRQDLLRSSFCVIHVALKIHHKILHYT